MDSAHNVLKASTHNTGRQEPTENRSTTQDKNKTDDTRLRYGSMTTVRANSLSVRRSRIPVVKPCRDCCLFFSLNSIPTDRQIFRLFFCLQPIISRLLDFPRLLLQDDPHNSINENLRPLPTCMQAAKDPVHNISKPVVKEPTSAASRSSSNCSSAPTLAHQCYSPYSPRRFLLSTRPKLTLVT